jgi:hypothetical protein
VKDIEFTFKEQIGNMVAKFGDDLTHEAVQRVFEEWITRLK